MKIQYFCHAALFVSGLMMATENLQPAAAEQFSFSLNGLGIKESSDGDRTFSGSLSIDGEQMQESKTIDFDLTHGDRGDSQTLEMGLSDQGESLLNAVFNLFGLTSNISEQDAFNAQVSGDVTPTESEIDVSLGQDLPRLQLKIQMPHNAAE
ncbi:MAG: hypothetical protein AAF587_44680 [Bacteroidota bacterium]